MTQRKIRLGAFIPGAGQHVASWRHPESVADGSVNLDHYIDMVRTAERGKFDAMFFADGLAANFGGSLKGVSEKVVGFEPLTLFSALSMITDNIGFIATASTTYEEPYNLARKFASLDLISKGRAAWNLVTSASNGTARNFNLSEQVAHAQRYARAEEFVDVTKKLWGSWEQDAFERDKEAGLFFDPRKVHPPHHQGKYFRVEGALNAPRSPQGHPVIVQAGQSEPGKEIAARTAEVVFTAQQNIEDAKAFYKDLKRRLAKYGRSADELLIMPGVTFFVGETHEEAQQHYDDLKALIHPDAGLALLTALSGGDVDLSSYPLDDPFPELPKTEGIVSRQAMMVDIAKRHNFSIRQLYEWIAGARGHYSVIGTPSEIADELQYWFENEAADGFNILPPVLPFDLNRFVDLVIPELQKRGIYRTEYEGKTLRENLGLKMPESRFHKTQKIELLSA